MRYILLSAAIFLQGCSEQNGGDKDTIRNSTENSGSISSEDPECGSEDAKNILEDILSSEASMETKTYASIKDFDRIDAELESDPRHIKLTANLQEATQQCSAAESRLQIAIKNEEDVINSTNEQDLLTRDYIALTKPAEDRRHSAQTDKSLICEEKFKAENEVYKSVQDHRSAEFQRLWNSKSYDFSYVVMTGKDRDTAKVTCKAEVVLSVPDWGSVTQQIRYTVEKTTDGRFLGTLLP